MNTNSRPLPWTLFLAELVGTALLILVGLSVVIVDFGQGSPVGHWLPNAGWRRLITGFLFGSTGALIALSPLGKESGAHINPVVSLSFWLMGKLRGRHTLGYVLAQLLGAIIGALPLLAWGAMGRSVEFGATEPGADYGPGWALLGEVITTFAMVIGLFFFIRHRKIRAFTPALFPVLYAVMVFLEAPISGTSTNPARSLGPAVIAGVWQDWWVYWLGPLIGALLGVATYRFTWLRHVEIEVAKLYHFEHDPHGIFRQLKEIHEDTPAPDVKLTNVAPVFVSANVKETVRYYVEILGFKYAEHFDKIDNFAALYRDEIELIIVQRKKGTVASNQARYGAGYDAYMDPDTLDGVNILYQEYKQKGVKILIAPHITDYGSFEFSFEDIDGRIIGVGLIADKATFFSQSNYLASN